MNMHYSIQGGKTWLVSSAEGWRGVAGRWRYEEQRKEDWAAAGIEMRRVTGIRLADKIKSARKLLRVTSDGLWQFNTAIVLIGAS